MFNSLGAPEILIIAIVVLVLFGAKRIPELARGLGQGIKEFRQASKDYMMRKRWDYFVKHLKNVDPPKEFEFGTQE